MMLDLQRLAVSIDLPTRNLHAETALINLVNTHSNQRISCHFAYIELISTSKQKELGPVSPPTEEQLIIF